MKYAYIDYEPQKTDELKSVHTGATYDEIRSWIQEKYGFNVTNLYIAQTKEKCGMEKRKNYNLGAENHKVPTCPAEKEKAILDAFKHFRMPYKIV